MPPLIGLWGMKGMEVLILKKKFSILRLMPSENGKKIFYLLFWLNKTWTLCSRVWDLSVV